jgi:hypothetical protein
MTIRPRLRAPIKNHTEKSCDGFRTDVVEWAVKILPASSKGVQTSSVAVFFFPFVFISTPLGRFFKIFIIIFISIIKRVCISFVLNKSVRNYLSSHMIKCLLTELGQARWENICLSVILY